MTWRKPSATPGTNLVDTYTNRPAAGLAWQRFTPTDGGPEFVWDGTLWRPALGTTLGYEPPSSGWSAVNGGNGASVSFANGVVELATTAVASTDKVGLAVRSMSGGGDFDLQARVRPILSLADSGGGTVTWESGLILRDSATGNFTWIHSQMESGTRRNQIQVTPFTSVNAGSAYYVRQEATQFFTDSAVWMGFKQVGTTRTMRLSNDGIRWWTIWTQTGASRYPLTPDQAGIAHTGYAGSTFSYDSGTRLESWRVA